MTTPVFSLAISTVSSKAEVFHSENGSPGSSACMSSWLARTSPLISSTKMATTASGSMSGTAHGSIPDCSLICRISTFALRLGSITIGKNPNRRGASSSVALTSSVFVLHGSPAGVRRLLSWSRVSSRPIPVMGSPSAQ